MSSWKWTLRYNIRFNKDNSILSNVKGMYYDKTSNRWKSYFMYGTKHSNIGIGIKVLCFNTYSTRNKKGI